MVITNDVSDS